MQIGIPAIPAPTLSRERRDSIIRGRLVRWTRIQVKPFKGKHFAIYLRQSQNMRPLSWPIMSAGAASSNELAHCTVPCSRSKNLSGHKPSEIVIESSMLSTRTISTASCKDFHQLDCETFTTERTQTYPPPKMNALNQISFKQNHENHAKKHPYLPWDGDKQ